MSQEGAPVDDDDDLEDEEEEKGKKGVRLIEQFELFS